MLLFFGGVERTPEKKVFLVHIRDRKSSTLIHEIRNHIKIGSIIYSDMWKGYCKLEEYGFKHYTVNHSKYFKPSPSTIQKQMLAQTQLKEFGVELSKLFLIM